MSRSSIASVCAPALLALAVLWTCDLSLRASAVGAMQEAAAEETEDLLQGTWLREYTVLNTRARRVLVLEADGQFRESVRAVDDRGGVLEQVHEGTWLYDGTNLKRKYTSMNGKPPSRLNVPFATFQIRFDSTNEFHGVDHIRGHRILYRRVSAGTLP